VTGALTRELSSTFDDHWSQPRLFYNSLTPVEQQWLVNAIRFESSHLQSDTVKQNVVTQLNRISNDVAARVAAALGLDAPAPDPTYYHDNTTRGISIVNGTLPTIATLQVGVLSSTKSLAAANALRARLEADGLVVTVVAETLVVGVNKTYSAADATDFDAVVVDAAADQQTGLFNATASSPFFPLGRPAQIAQTAYAFGKPVGYYGASNGTISQTLAGAGYVAGTPGVYSGSYMESFVSGLEDGLAVFKFTDRFPLDS
jgi:catalase